MKNTDISPFDEIVDHFRGSLHDYLNVLLVARFKAETIAEQLKNEGSPHAAEANELTANLNEVHSDLRLLLLNMRMPRLGERSFREALMEYTGFLGSDISLSLAGSEEINQFPETADTFFVICREAIANATRHGKAKHISITIKKLGNDIHLEIIDDGHGFDPTTIKSRSGLYFMEKFAKSLDGTFLIESKIGSGTTLTISVPEQENRKSDNDN